MTRNLFTSVLLLATLPAVVSAFQLSPATTSLSRRLEGISPPSSAEPINYPKRSTVILQSTKEKQKKKGGFDEGLRTKLVSESIAPWRNLRLFLYGALGSGAAVGGFITLAGTLAALTGARTDVDLNTEVG